MATKLTTSFVSDGFGIGRWSSFNSNSNSNSNKSKKKRDVNNVNFIFLTSPRFLHVSCKMRHRDLSSRHKRQEVRKTSPGQPPTNADFQSNDNGDNEDSDTEHYTVPLLRHEAIPNETVNADKLEHPMGAVVEHIQPPSAGFRSGVDKDSNIENYDAPFLEHEIINTELVDSGKDAEREPQIDADGWESNNDIINNSDDVDHERHIDEEHLESGTEMEQSDRLDDIHSNTLTTRGNMPPATLNTAGLEGLSSIHLEDLTGMIRNAENNILLLNQARVRALQDVDRICSEKETLQEEINALQMRMAENDAKMKIATQQKIHVELLESQLDQLRFELKQRGATERVLPGTTYKNHNQLSDTESSVLQNSSVRSVSEELVLLRKENMSLKNDMEVLKTERSILESSLRDLELKLSVSQEDVSKLSALKFECETLWEKVESLQTSLSKATEQADQAIVVLQQNHDLRDKVYKLEESLEEANAYKLSSEKLQQYNELMQQKIQLLEEHLQRSDEDIYSYIKLYQDSAQEFQDTLNSLKEESKKRALNEPVDDMPQEFWSSLLLMIDGWLLEKKISTSDAKILREMTWKRERRICDAYVKCNGRNEHEAISMFLKLTSSSKSAGLYVVHIAAEMAPVAKVGGLGDVVAGLGKALQKRGHLVEIILPKYDCIQYNRVQDLRVVDMVLESYFDGRLHKSKVWIGTVEGLPVYFIEPHHQDKFFWRGQFYGEPDDFKRFSFFSRAALELLFHAGKKPDIIHCHDWQTAFVAPLYWDIYAPKGLNSARICFTCHNFEYQGTAPAFELASCGLDVHQLNRPDRMQDNSDDSRINPVKGAVVFSNIVTTVSPTYAQEVQTAEGGKGLHSTLNFHSRKFVGILNGIDTDAWNPATDPYLKVQYTANDLEGKTENKIATRKHLRLSNTNLRQPMVGCITRLVPQKGVHLIRHAIYRTLDLGGQFILLGSSPVAHVQREFEDIANKFQNHDQIRLILKYDESLSRSIFAASDMFIIPSIFEPCGLTQMIAMRYGSVPIARKTGGLNDSVFDIDDDSTPFQFRNGFTFSNPNEHEFNTALECAFSYYRNNAEGWKQLVQKDMNIDFSWQSSAQQYDELYVKAVARARAAAG